MSRTPEYNWKQAIVRSFKPLVDALRVCVINTDSDPVPVTIVAGGTTSLIRTFIEENNFDPNATVDYITQTVPAGKTWSLKRATVTCAQPVKFVVTVGGSTVGSGRLNPSVPNRDFDWPDGYEVAAGVEVKVTLTLLHGKPINTSAEAYLMVRET